MNIDEATATPAPASALSLLPAPASKLSHDRAVQLLTLAAGLPGAVVCLALLWAGDWSPKVQWTFSALVICTWLGCVLAVRERVIYPMQTLSNLLNALREGDYSLRSRRARRDDALGEVMREINALGETLVNRRRQASEAVALLQAVITGIDVAVFTFDDAGRLRLVNRVGAGLLGRPEQALVGRQADELGLAPALAGEPHRTFAADFPGKPGARWSLHRTSFREGGRPHQLLVLADVSQSLREEERAAWQRLIRVLGHEINNSLAPIHSIAGSLLTLLARPEPQRAPDWQNDFNEGLGVIVGRSDALNRFLLAYSRLARLPPPEPRRQSLSVLVRRAAALETRLPVEVHCEQDVIAAIDGDQVEQALINLIRNAADAALETAGGVRVSCVMDGGAATVTVEDDGMGLSGTANLFVPFFTTKTNGSGIGLVLSRQIVEAHSGSLTLEDRADGYRGCRAVIRLPL
jgi:two-component system nitrogen regulation sensor histidine kinase NtrY